MEFGTQVPKDLGMNGFSNTPTVSEALHEAAIGGKWSRQYMSPSQEAIIIAPL